MTLERETEHGRGPVRWQDTVLIEWADLMREVACLHILKDGPGFDRCTQLGLN